MTASNAVADYYKFGMIRRCNDFLTNIQNIEFADENIITTPAIMSAIFKKLFSSTSFFFIIYQILKFFSYIAMSTELIYPVLITKLRIICKKFFS